MNFNQMITELGKVAFQFKKSAIEFLPNFLGAVVIFLIGFLIAKLLRALVYRFFKNIGRLIPYEKVQSRLQPTKLEPSASIISDILYWFIIFFFITVATEAMGLPVVTMWLSGIASYLPKILAAVLIGIFGIIGGVILRDIIISAAASAGITYGNVLGKFAQYAILLTTILIAIDQIGIDISFLMSIIMILVAAVLFGAALSFGLGARTSVSNILASYYLQKTYKIGHRVKIGDMEGEIIQITPTAVILETPYGQVCVPAKQFNEMISVMLTKDQSYES
jgi:small-conductance mechanosensitive channel